MRTFLTRTRLCPVILLLTHILVGSLSAGQGARENDVLLVNGGVPAGELRPLIGRWLRPDGGYILEIRKSGPNGKLEAYYFNPRSINVHRAEAYRDNAGLKVRVELRDAGYPGSTYALLYLPDRDILAGYYFQAGRKQYFEVLFIREEKP